MKPRCVTCSYCIPCQIKAKPPLSTCGKTGQPKQEMHCERGCEHYSMLHPYLIAERIKNHPFPK